MYSLFLTISQASPKKANNTFGISFWGERNRFLQDLLDTSQYVSSEMSALEREQKQIDERAAEVEWSLRQIMDKGNLCL